MCSYIEHLLFHIQTLTKERPLKANHHSLLKMPFFLRGHVSLKRTAALVQIRWRIIFK
jgi:hypothetical protein